MDARLPKKASHRPVEEADVGVLHARELKRLRTEAAEAQHAKETLQRREFVLNAKSCARLFFTKFGRDDSHDEEKYWSNTDGREYDTYYIGIGSRDSSYRYTLDDADVLPEEKTELARWFGGFGWTLVRVQCPWMPRGNTMTELVVRVGPEPTVLGRAPEDAEVIPAQELVRMRQAMQNAKAQPKHAVVLTKSAERLLDLKHITREFFVAFKTNDIQPVYAGVDDEGSWFRLARTSTARVMKELDPSDLEAYQQWLHVFGWELEGLSESIECLRLRLL